MPGPDDRLRSAMERLAAPADPSGAYERIVEKKVHRRIMRRLEIAALAFVVLAGTVGGTFALTRAFRTTKAQRVPLTIVNPGNGQIAFVTDRDGNPEIYAINEDGTGLKRLTHDTAVDAFPAWSPDGRQIVFVRATETRQDIYVMAADGSKQRDLTPTVTAREGDPAWSPDGRQIAFASDQSGTYEIWVMHANGSGPRQLTDVASPGVNHPTWSPDGQKIAFSAFLGEGRGGAIYVMNAEGEEVRTLFREKQENVVDLLRAGAWSPDGTTLLFTREVRGNRPGTSDLYAIRSDGTGLRRVVDRTSRQHLGALWGGTWSPDGKEIAFEGSVGVYTIPADGSGPQKVTDDGASFGVSWQPIPGAKEATPTASGSAPPSPSPSPEPSMTPSPGPTPPDCATSFVYGDFDGSGRNDTAAICRAKDGTFNLTVLWAGGASGSVGMPDCQDVCIARGAGDLNGDGKEEFFLEYAQGASTEFVEVYELPASEAFGQHPVRTAKPGSPPGFPADKSAQFDIGGSVTHQGYLTCQLSGDSTPEVTSTGTQLSQDRTTWNVHETVLTLQGSDLSAQFVVVSSRDYTAPNDPNQPFVPPGDPCLDL